jgi:hypothetical protein
MRYVLEHYSAAMNNPGMKRNMAIADQPLMTSRPSINSTLIAIAWTIGVACVGALIDGTWHVFTFDSRVSAVEKTVVKDGESRVAALETTDTKDNQRIVSLQKQVDDLTKQRETEEARKVWLADYLKGKH